MARYKFQIVVDITVQADTREQARDAAMMAKLDVPEAVRGEWPAPITPGRTKLVTVPAKPAR